MGKLYRMRDLVFRATVKQRLRKITDSGVTEQ